MDKTFSISRDILDSGTGMRYHVVTYSGVEASIFELAGARTSHNWFHTAAHISQPPTQLVCLVDKGYFVMTKSHRI